MCSDMISNLYLGLLHIITKWTCMHFAIWFKLWDWRVTLPHVTRKSLRTPLLWLESASPSCKQKCFWDIGGALIGMDMQHTTNWWESGMPRPTLKSHTLSNQRYRLYETSITMVQSYTKKYHKFAAVCIIRRSAHDLQYLIRIHMTCSTDTDSRVTYSKKYGFL